MLLKIQLLLAIKNHWFFIFPIVIFSYLLIACQSEFPSTPVTENFPNEMRPSYLKDVVPREQSTLSLTEFQNEENYRGNGLYDSSGGDICVTWDASTIVEPGDQLGLEKAVGQVSLWVNDREVELNSSIMLPAQKIKRFDNDQEASYGGPFYFCWATDPKAGRKLVKLQTRKTSGDVLEYSWYFELEK